MILTTADYEARKGFDADMAQTVASWWMSPGAPALVTFATRGQVSAGLRDEVKRELEGLTDASEGWSDLRQLLAWANWQGVDSPDFELFD